MPTQVLSAFQITLCLTARPETVDERADIPVLRKRVILVAHSRRIPQHHPDDDPWAINGYENLA
ncbi:hypothetical protein [Streptomyces sp. NPDC002845]